MSKTNSTFKYCTFFAKKLDKVIILAKWLYGRKQKFVVGSPYNFVERESHISSELEARPLNIILIRKKCTATYIAKCKIVDLI